MTGKIVSVFGNMVIAEIDGRVVQNSVGYCCRSDGARLLSEVIRVRGRMADLQVFEETRGLRVGDLVEIEDAMLSVTLGPGLLGEVYDGLQNPLWELASEAGFFLRPGTYIRALSTQRQWDFTPTVAPGAVVEAGSELGWVPEGIFRHLIMVPFSWQGRFTVDSIAPAGAYPIDREIAVLTGDDGRAHSVTMTQSWPVKVPLNVSRRRLMPTEPLVTRVRIIDSMFPIVRGGTYCIPGPFGAGKTVLQQITSRHAEIDIVIVAACGERAGEVVETLREFPELTDPRTGKSLMERTIIICNTSAMPVAAREASVYTAATLAEYYRQMGLNVLLLADSTSRWAQAMREVSGRLEEIPGEEAFPAYLESRIASFYERAGAIELKDGRIASLTIGGTVSPAGGNFEEPVTQGTLKVVGAFHGLSRARSDARRYPSIDPLDSWSKYTGIIAPGKVAKVRNVLRRGAEVRQMMAVVGEEGTSIKDFVIALKADFFDNCYLQQNAFDEVDAATPADRQRFVFDKILAVLELEVDFATKDDARRSMVTVTDLFRNWNYAATDGDEYRRILGNIDAFIASSGRGAADGPHGQPVVGTVAVGPLEGSDE
ncbi:MAG TPA: V-type ATP synthase subunit A [Thermoanaerobaculales bacterium]|nr:V-type ATP synthase subunit A [Thermoanaerobaculales bacterium]HQL29313.1 V-type ATP synthase subunit A [Thermoanaerobaculales bacterium]